MNRSRSFIIRLLPLLLVTLFCCQPICAVTGEHPVLIISSYNPDSRQTSGNISDFMDEFQRLGGTNNIALENMNCKSFSESPLWKGKMKQLLSKYTGVETPALIVLIGQEAWAAYLSLKESISSKVPVLVALASRNAIILPDEQIDLKTWMPASVDLFTDFPHSQVKAGFVYEYDIAANIGLIKKLYPQTQNIAFISDNSYGGVALQAHVVKEMKRFPDLKLILLDGRVHTIYTISDELHKLPAHTVLLMGTWRVDMNDGYFMRNATYAMMEAASGLPTFSVTSVGLGYWAIGGVVPSYRSLGKDIAWKTVQSLGNPRKGSLEVIPNKIVMDSRVVKERGLDLSFISQPIEMMNESPSFYKQYRYQIWFLVALLVILLLGLLISLYFYYHTKILKDELEESEGALREAKNHAEESNQLKSAFLANMSHEIRTPLNAIVGFSDVLSSGDSSVEEQRNYFEIIKRNSDLLLRLINDILDVSRLEVDRVTFTIEKLDVVHLCRQVLASVDQARKSDNKFVFECKYEVLELNTDLQRLQQVIINLLSNADKFTQNGRITLKIEVDESKAIMIYSVTDTGCGIPLEKQKLVFNRFEKLNEYMQGTGLGLSICQLIVQKWGGEIWIDSTYVEGTRFFFTHPLQYASVKNSI